MSKKDQNPEQFLQSCALKYVSRYATHSQILRKHLLKKASSLCFNCESLVHEIVDAFSKKGYVNDSDYIQSFIRHSMASGYSIAKVKAKLYDKQIKPDEFDQALELLEIDPDEFQLKSLIRYIEKKKISIQDADDDKILAKILRQGFSYGHIQKVKSQEA